MGKLTEARPTIKELSAQIAELRQTHRDDPESLVGQEAWNLLAELLVEDGDIILEALGTNSVPESPSFLAALTGICANPHFFGPLMQQQPQAAIDFAKSVASLRALGSTEVGDGE